MPNKTTRRPPRSESQRVNLYAVAAEESLIPDSDIQKLNMLYSIVENPPHEEREIKEKLDSLILYTLSDKPTISQINEYAIEVFKLTKVGDVFGGSLASFIRGEIHSEPGHRFGDLVNFKQIFLDEMDKEFLKFIVANYHDELNSKDILRLKNEVLIPHASNFFDFHIQIINSMPLKRQQREYVSTLLPDVCIGDERLNEIIVNNLRFMSDHRYNHRSLTMLSKMQKGTPAKFSPSLGVDGPGLSVMRRVYSEGGETHHQEFLDVAIKSGHYHLVIDIVNTLLSVNREDELQLTSEDISTEQQIALLEAAIDAEPIDIDERLIAYQWIYNSLPNYLPCMQRINPVKYLEEHHQDTRALQKIHDMHKAHYQTLASIFTPAQQFLIQKLAGKSEILMPNKASLSSLLEELIQMQEALYEQINTTCSFTSRNLSELSTGITNAIKRKIIEKRQQDSYPAVICYCYLLYLVKKVFPTSLLISDAIAQPTIEQPVIRSEDMAQRSRSWQIKQYVGTFFHGVEQNIKAKIEKAKSLSPKSAAAAKAKPVQQSGVELEIYPNSKRAPISLNKPKNEDEDEDEAEKSETRSAIKSPDIHEQTTDQIKAQRTYIEGILSSSALDCTRSEEELRSIIDAQLEGLTSHLERVPVSRGCGSSFQDMQPPSSEALLKIYGGFVQAHRQDLIPALPDRHITL